MPMISILLIFEVRPGWGCHSRRLINGDHVRNNRISGRKGSPRG
jgi:hypothetical protein